MKTLFLATVLLIVFMGWGVYVASQYKTPEIVSAPSNSTAILSPTVSLAPTPIPGAPPTPRPVTPIPTPVPTPVPTPPPSSCGSGGPCTAAQIATHNTASNCWVYLTTNSKVYNITGYISSGTHPAGSSVITPACGKDMTPYFITGAIGGHRHSNSAINSVLAAYYIGPFQ